ncbi:MAG: hypothetical protein SFT93_04275 [Rickettsiaceae bacterium]|nr:hypothetical protein [Rickettsiaceae bacterium]
MTKKDARTIEKRRGNDKGCSGNDNGGVIPVKTGIQETCHPPRRRGSSKHVIHSKEGIQ